MQRACIRFSELLVRASRTNSVKHACIDSGTCIDKGIVLLLRKRCIMSCITQGLSRRLQ